MEYILKVAGIVGQSITDGPGLRFTIFVQGCPHHCKGCHNPQTHTFEGGEVQSIKDIFLKIKANPLVRGVTFSGGEPMCQAEAFYKLAVMLKEENYEIACYTGYAFEELVSSTDTNEYNLLTKLDILIDGKFVEEQKNLDLWFRGSENQRILDVPESLKTGKAVMTHQHRWTGEGE